MCASMAGNPLTDPNWARDAADTVERVVGEVRRRTTDNLVLIARGVVFGLFAALVGVAAVVLAMIVVTRALQALLEIGVDHPRAVYLSYFVLGGILLLAGGLTMAKRRPPAD